MFYMSTNLRLLADLQNLQNKALKICLNSPFRTDTNLVHTQTKMARLEHRRTCHQRNYMHRRIMKHIYVDNRLFSTRVRDALLMKTTRPNCKMCERSVYYRGANEWNSLSVFERSIESFDNFKSYQKCWLKSDVSSLSD